MDPLSALAFPAITVGLPVAAASLLWIAISLHRIVKDITTKKEK